MVYNNVVFLLVKLEDEDTLADHGADKEGTVVHIVLRLRGGKSTVFTNTASFEGEAHMTSNHIDRIIGWNETKSHI